MGRSPCNTASARRCRTHSPVRREQFCEGARPMGQRQFLLRTHLAESLLIAIWYKHWIIAEAPIASRRPDHAPARFAFEGLDLAVRRGQSQHANEARGKIA